MNLFQKVFRPATVLATTLMVGCADGPKPAESSPVVAQTTSGGKIFKALAERPTPIAPFSDAMSNAAEMWMLAQCPPPAFRKFLR
jgi:hypothetical protein